MNPAKMGIAILLAAALLLVWIPQPAAATDSNLVLSSATTTGNVTSQTSSYGLPGLSILSAQTRFPLNTLLTCEQVYNTASGGGGLGALTGWFIGTAGGQRGVFQNSAPSAGFYTYYWNYCVKGNTQGYNESAQLLIHASLYLNKTSGTLGGSVIVGFGKTASSPALYSTCGPFLELSLASTGAVNAVKTGVGFPGGNYKYGAATSLSIPIKTWFDVWVWQNKSSQHANIRAQGVTTAVSSAFSWAVTSCGGAGQNIEAGTTILVNQTAALAGSGGFVEATNVTIGSQGASTLGIQPRVGFATIPNIAPPAQVSYLKVTATMAPNIQNSGSPPPKASSAGICPCYINRSGVNLWTTATTYMTLFYNATTFLIPVTGVAAGAAVSVALRLNATDGLSNVFISSIAIPGSVTWNNPGGTQGAVNQAGTWIGPMVFVMLAGLLFFSIVMAYRDRFTK